MQAAAMYTWAVEVSSSSLGSSGSGGGGGGGGGDDESGGIALAKDGLYDVVKIIVDHAKEKVCKEGGSSIKDEILSVLQVEQATPNVSS